MFLLPMGTCFPSFNTVSVTAFYSVFHGALGTYTGSWGASWKGVRRKPSEGVRSGLSCPSVDYSCSGSFLCTVFRKKFHCSMNSKTTDLK